MDIFAAVSSEPGIDARVFAVLVLIWLFLSGIGVLFLWFAVFKDVAFRKYRETAKGRAEIIKAVFPPRFRR